jgi:hypothetical protein
MYCAPNGNLGFIWIVVLGLIMYLMETMIGKNITHNFMLEEVKDEKYGVEKIMKKERWWKRII